MFCFPGLGSLWQICRHQGLSGIHSKLEGYFFPWHFSAETAPSRKLKSVTLPNMSFLLPLYFISTGKEGRHWPMSAGQWDVATAGGLHGQRGNWSDAIFHTKRETILGTTGWNLCYAGGRNLSISSKLPSYFRGIGLVFSRRPSYRKSRQCGVAERGWNEN